MGKSEDAKFFHLRKEGRTYFSKIFSRSAENTERQRFAYAVYEGLETPVFGEIDGALCLRLTGEKRKTQVSAIVTQDHRKVRRITLQRFQTRNSGSDHWLEGYESESFSFRSDEFERLLQFLNRLKFVDLSNEERFQIDDLSMSDGPKVILDAEARPLVEKIKELSETGRERLFRALQTDLTSKEINLLLGRRQAIEQFDSHLSTGDWSELDWQDFFEQQKWVFGYGLDYRIMRPFDREMVVGSAGSDNREKPTVDYLMTFTDYTALVEIKRPDTPIFQQTRSGRAGTWRLSTEFIQAVSQVLEQKAEWLSAAQSKDQFNKSGTQRLEARTRDAKTILVIGSRAQFSEGSSLRDAEIKRDTFELFRRNGRSIEILTFDELYERALFITRDD